MKKLIVLSFGFVAFILAGCPDDIDSYPFFIVNNATHSIGVYVAWGAYDKRQESTTAYPDTTLPKKNDNVIAYDVKYGKTLNLAPRNPLEEIFETLPADTLSVFIFHRDTLEKYSWQEVRDGYKVLKRYDLSLEDIKRMNYTITHP